MVETKEVNFTFERTDSVDPTCLTMMKSQVDDWLKGSVVRFIDQFIDELVVESGTEFTISVKIEEIS